MFRAIDTYSTLQVINSICGSRNFNDKVEIQTIFGTVYCMLYTEVEYLVQQMGFNLLMVLISYLIPS